MVSCPLLTPLTFLCADTSEMCSEAGVRGLGSVRRADFGTLLCPEFPLRSSPRITVRGQTVQNDNVLLRKAPLRSRMCPWSTRRPCGPLAFRRATEGSRVRGKMWGCQEGDKKPGGCLGPLLPPPPGGGLPHAMSWRTSPVPGEASLACGGKPPYRRKVNRQPTVKKQRLASAEKQKPPSFPGGSQYLCEQQNISFRGCA